MVKKQRGPSSSGGSSPRDSVGSIAGALFFRTLFQTEILTPAGTESLALACFKRSEAAAMRKRRGGFARS
jgi:hypothetical protein